MEALNSILEHAGVDAVVRKQLSHLFVDIQKAYPLGHGYFADYRKNSDPSLYYLTRIRPVLRSHLQQLHEVELSAIDNLVDDLVS